MVYTLGLPQAQGSHSWEDNKTTPESPESNHRLVTGDTRALAKCRWTNSSCTSSSQLSPGGKDTPEGPARGTQTPKSGRTQMSCHKRQAPSRRASYTARKIGPRGLRAARCRLTNAIRLAITGQDKGVAFWGLSCHFQLSKAAGSR